MTPSDDRRSPPPPASPEPTPDPPRKAAPGQSEAREARLAAALRANLRRRKSGPKSGG